MRAVVKKSPKHNFKANENWNREAVVGLSK